MARRNGKPEMDVDHELPAADEVSEGDASVARQTASADGGELQRVTAERDTLLDRLARAQAEFDNSRKRAAREQQDYRDYAQSDTVKALLPIMDSFERALRADSLAHEKSQNSELRNGIELIYKQLQDALLKLGVQPIPAKGEPFDPRVHEAIEMVDTTDAEDHQVLEELQRGYKLKERLLRPAMVKVARNPHSI
jgi:molecular chaperone GrpE